MKIGPLDSKPVAAAPVAERKASGAAATAGGSPAAASATVALSQAAAELSELPADPTFDSAKVERIAQAIRDGEFKVNPEAIADKLIGNAQELLARKPS